MHNTATFRLWVLVHALVDSETKRQGEPAALLSSGTSPVQTPGSPEIALRGRAFHWYSHEGSLQTSSCSFPSTIGPASRPLKMDPLGSAERGLKGLILCLTHWVSTSRRLPCAQFTHEHRRCISSTPLSPIFKSGIRAKDINHRR